MESSERPAGLARSVDEFLVRIDGLRDRPAVSASATALVGVLVAIFWWLAQASPEPADEAIPMAGTTSASASASDTDGAAGPGQDQQSQPGNVSSTTVAPPDESTTLLVAPLVVHVSGAVVRQGLVEVPDGARLADAISQAGGALAEADLHRLNLATPAVDGMHVRVPFVDEANDDPLPLIDFGRQTRAASSTDPAADGQSRLVDINQAGAPELETLPGVGPATAAAIIAWRQEHGPFTVIDDLLAVPGIGPAKLNAIEALVVV